MTGTLSNTVVDSGSLFADGVAAMLPGLIAPMLSEHAARRADVDMARLTGNYKRGNERTSARHTRNK